MLSIYVLISALFASCSYAACSDHYTGYVREASRPDLLQVTDASTQQCVYNANTLPGPPSTFEICDITCPAGWNLLTYCAADSAEYVFESARLETGIWTGLGGNSGPLPLDATMQFGCIENSRCDPFIDADGVCKLKDNAAICNVDPTKPLCTCSASYTGVKCTILIELLQRINQWLEPEQTKKLLEVFNEAQWSPAVLIDLLPSIFAAFTTEQQKAMSWTKEDLIDSVDFEMDEVDYNVAFTPIFDDVMGNCFTFNYANTTNSDDGGLYKSRFAGQHRDLSVILKVDPSEEVAWIDRSAISLFIHAPGTQPKQGAQYVLKASASDLIALRKMTTILDGGCLSSRDQLKQNFYDDGDYTRDGCYSACYQDKVMEKCGCMDARFKKPASTTKCLFKDNSCIDAVAAEFGPASAWSSCHCPPECYQEVYTLAATQADLPYKIPTCANITHGCPDPTPSRARLTIFMESLENEVYVQAEKMTFLTLLSQIGGQLGVLLGMSVVGVIEIIMLCGQIGKALCSSNTKR